MATNPKPTESLGDFGGEPKKGTPARGQAFEDVMQEREAKAVTLPADKAIKGPEDTK